MAGECIPRRGPRVLISDIIPRKMLRTHRQEFAKLITQRSIILWLNCIFHYLNTYIVYIL